MTNNEAINVLRQVNKILVSDKSWLENTHEPLNTVFDMAIEALKDKEAREQYEKWEAIEEEEAREYFEGRKQPNAPQRDNGVLERVKMQEHCEDYISRQAMLDGLASIAKAKARSDAQKSLMGRVMFFTEHLPSVTPQQKVGEWLEKEVNSDKIEEWQSARCSVCDRYHTTPYMYYFNNYKFCPNCGAKMVKPQESEDKE